MKRYFLTACAIAISSLGIVAPRASAVDKSHTYQVPFTGFAISACLLENGIVTPGVLTSDSEGKSLETLTPGTVTYLCNEATEVSVGASVQKEVIAGGPDELQDSTPPKVSSILSNDSPLTLPSELTGLTIPAGLNVVSVEMTASKEDNSVIAGGVYSFDVPLTITCK